MFEPGHTPSFGKGQHGPNVEPGKFTTIACCFPAISEITSGNVISSESGAGCPAGRVVDPKTVVRSPSTVSYIATCIGKVVSEAGEQVTPPQKAMSRFTPARVPVMFAVYVCPIYCPPRIARTASVGPVKDWSSVTADTGQANRKGVATTSVARRRRRGAILFNMGSPCPDGLRGQPTLALSGCGRPPSPRRNLPDSDAGPPKSRWLWLSAQGVSQHHHREGYPRDRVNPFDLRHALSDRGACADWSAEN